MAPRSPGSRRRFLMTVFDLTGRVAVVTGLYRDRLEISRQRLKIRDKLILLDTFAVPTLLATPL